jgi:hypothetical protein
MSESLLEFKRVAFMFEIPWFFEETLDCTAKPLGEFVNGSALSPPLCLDLRCI